MKPKYVKRMNKILQNKRFFIKDVQFFISGCSFNHEYAEIWFSADSESLQSKEIERLAEEHGHRLEEIAKREEWQCD